MEAVSTEVGERIGVPRRITSYYGSDYGNGAYETKSKNGDCVARSDEFVVCIA